MSREEDAEGGDAGAGMALCNIAKNIIESIVKIIVKQSKLLGWIPGSLASDYYALGRTSIRLYSQRI